MKITFWMILSLCLSKVSNYFNAFHGSKHGPFERKYNKFPEADRLEMQNKAKNMFYFAYTNYMDHAFPLDELDPIHCTGRGPDKEHPENININDVLGDYSLTLIESLGTLAIMGNASEFKRAVNLVVKNVSFDKDSTIQVFEATIRILGSLLSAHMIATNEIKIFDDLKIENYDNELLSMAHDLATRLLPAFDKSPTGIPYPRVNLRYGVPIDSVNTTCTAGAGTLLLEFGVLSRLLKDPVYESVARRAVERLWTLRSNVTGLFGSIINMQTGEWEESMSGLGAGIDSFYEYLLKGYILFGNESDLKKFKESYETIKFYLRKGRPICNSGWGHPPLYVNVNMKSGKLLNNWIDALQASWPAVQVIFGDVDEAICTHAYFYAIWRKYGVLPERFNWHLSAPDVYFYPLRPEFAESTYLLYQATKNPFYLHVGKDIIESLETHTKAKCGFATVHNVGDKSLEDRMESFFVSETSKYLYLLFDEANPVNMRPTDYLFTTEGHIFPISNELRKVAPFLEEMQTKSTKDFTEKLQVREIKRESDTNTKYEEKDKGTKKNLKPLNEINTKNRLISYSPLHGIENSSINCNRPEVSARKFSLPIYERYLQQIDAIVGVEPIL